MIQAIYVENYIIIEKISLDLSSGFSCFTGETGAGKSLIIDALGILLGDRFSIDYIRKGQEYCRIEATVVVDLNEARDLLIEAGFGDEPFYVFSRELTIDNRSSVRINGRSCTATFMKDVLSKIIDIHSQHDNQYLLNRKYHLNLLDRYTNNSLLKEVSAAYQVFHKLDTHLNELKEKKYNPSELDFLTYQVKEIDELHLKEGEIEELENRFKLLASFEKNALKLDNVINIIDNNNLLENFWQGIKELDHFNDEEILTINSSFRDSYFMLEEAFNRLNDYRKHIDFSEAEINKLQSRLFEIKKIQRKFGDSYEAIMNKRSEMLTSIKEIENSEEVLNNLSVEVLKAFNHYHKLALDYREARKAAAVNLALEIEAHLKDLDLANTRFIVDFKDKKPASDGIDDVEFLLTTNVNIDPRPLIKVASGGELSRMMLGLKIIFARLQGISTIIFDEIDTGVSGTTAFSIGLKMQELAKSLQVLAITHLAQVVACSDYHYYVNKLVLNNETLTSVSKLDYDKTIHQMAILGFSMANDDSIRAAKTLYQQGRRQ